MIEFKNMVMRKLKELLTKPEVFVFKRNILATGVVLLVLCMGLVYMVYELEPVVGDIRGSTSFEVRRGDGFRVISDRLHKENLIRSKTAFEIFAIVTGSAYRLKPGIYPLNQTMSANEVLTELVSGSHHEVTVKIPEGASIYSIDKILSEASVLPRGILVSAGKEEKLEGRLFPDTYKFFTDSSKEEVLDKFLKNFSLKAEPLFKNTSNTEANLILASLIQKEVADPFDEQLVAGILKKRIGVHNPLQVDASICYIKQVLSYPGDSSCYPLVPLDFRLDSPYNTYLHTGLPPGPIGNPGVFAIFASVHPKNSPYWYYLSDPKTKKTIFSRTLDEHDNNRSLYLK